MPEQMTSQNTESLQLPTAGFSCCFYWHKKVDKEPDLEKLQRGLYLDLSRCSAANGGKP